MLRIAESLIISIEDLPTHVATAYDREVQEEHLAYLKSSTDIEVGFGRTLAINHLTELMDKARASDALSFFVGKVKEGAQPKEGILDLDNTIDLIAMYLAKGETINQMDVRRKVLKDMVKELNVTKQVIEDNVGTVNSPVIADLLNKLDMLDKAGARQLNLVERGDFIQLIFPHLTEKEAQAMNDFSVHQIELHVELNQPEDDLGSQAYARAQVEHLIESCGINSVIRLMDMSEDDTIQVTHNQKEMIMDAAEYLESENLGIFGIDDDVVSGLEDLEVGGRPFISHDAFKDLNYKIDKYVKFIRFVEQFHPLNQEEVRGYLRSQPSYQM